jgi:hypothetical protein
MAKREKPKMGRPPGPPGEQRTIQVKVLVNASEKAELQAAAAREERDLSEWLRMHGLKIARAGE